MGLSDQSKESHQAFERSIALSPKVRECHNITGPFEDLLRVEVEYLAAYTVFHTDVLRTLPQERAITTCVVTDSAKDQRA